MKHSRVLAAAQHSAPEQNTESWGILESGKLVISQSTWHPKIKKTTHPLNTSAAGHMSALLFQFSNLFVSIAILGSIIMLFAMVF